MRIADNAKSNAIQYEFPLNERIRRFLRLEFLFVQTEYYLEGQSQWESRAVLLHLIEILESLSRSDIKGELMAELERHHSQFERYNDRPEVNQQQLEQLLGNLRHLIEELCNYPGQLGQSLRDMEFINSIRQRVAIPGGTCTFDLPAFHAWLQQPHQTRQLMLQQWYDELALPARAIHTILQMIRETGVRSQEAAYAGVFERDLDPERPFQLVKITLPPNTSRFPEISAGRHRITIRFLEQPDFRQRPVLCAQDINFRLALCGAA